MLYTGILSYFKQCRSYLFAGVGGGFSVVLRMIVAEDGFSITGDQERRSELLLDLHCLQGE